MKNKIEQTVKLILETLPSFIETKNSYERKIIYESIQYLNSQHNLNIKCNRSFKWIDQFATHSMCYKHKSPLLGGCDCCSDPWCSGPYCTKCGHHKYCSYAVEQGDLMYKSKTCVGLNLYYDSDLNIKFKIIKNQNL